MKEFLSSREVAELFGCSVRTIQKKLQAGEYGEILRRKDGHFNYAIPRQIIEKELNQKTQKNTDVFLNFITTNILTNKERQHIKSLPLKLSENPKSYSMRFEDLKLSSYERGKIGLDD